MKEKILRSILMMLLVLAGFSIWTLRSEAEPPALARLKGAEKERVSKLIEGAKKEGELVAYASILRPDVQADLNPMFMEEYGLSESNFKIKMTSMRTEAIVAKITEELRAKVYKTDVVQDTAFDWFNELMARGELMPYESPEYKRFCPISVNPEIGQGNPPYFIAGTFSTYTLFYNPKYVKGDIISWKDILRPEHKGKIACGDVTKSFSYTAAYLAFRKVLPADFFRTLAKQEPFLLVSASDFVNKAIPGEYPIAALTSPGPAFRANLEGAGLKIVFPTEGVAAVGRQTAILSRAPHPNAAKLFIDFFHADAAQKIIMNKEGYPTGRLGLKSQYPESIVPIYDVKGAIQMDWRKVTDKERNEAREEFRRIMIEKK